MLNLILSKTKQSAILLPYASSQLYAIEVKLSNNIIKSDVNGLLAFADYNKAKVRPIVVCTETQKRILTRDPCITV